MFFGVSVPQEAVRGGGHVPPVQSIARQAPANDDEGGLALFAVWILGATLEAPASAPSAEPRSSDADLDDHGLQLTLTGCRVTGPSRPQSLRGQSAASKGL